MPSTWTTEELAPRVSTLESQVSNLATDVAETNRAVQHLSDNVSRGFEAVNRGLAHSGRPNFGVMGVWAGVLLAVLTAIGGAFGSGYVREADEMRTTVHQLSDRFSAHEKDQSYAQGRLDQGLLDLRKEFADHETGAARELDRLDGKIQGEARLIDGNTRERLSVIDQRLSERSSENHGQIEQLWDTVNGAMKDSFSRHAENAERLRALERAAFGTADKIR